jgi:Transposase zinc-ribbon domain
MNIRIDGDHRWLETRCNFERVSAKRSTAQREKCCAAVIASRWPNGFECPACGDRGYCEVKTRGLFQCSACRHQASPIAGTIFASTHLPLRLWFRAMYHLTQSKQGISSIELGRRLGVTQTSAWKIKHKLA